MSVGKMRWLFVVLLLVGATLVASMALASVPGVPGTLLDSFTQAEIDADWEADRQFPSDGATSVSAFGRDDVLRIGIDSTETAAACCFTRTEGLKTVGFGDFGDFVQVDLYLDPAWADGAVRAGLWVAGENGSGGRDAFFGILEFVNNEPCPEPDCTNPTNITDHEGFRIYDSTVGWTSNLATAFTYGEWVTLGIELDAAAEMYIYYIDGVEVGSADGGENFIGEVFLNSYNYGLDSFPTLDSDSYAAHWHVGEELPIVWTTVVVSPDDMQDWAFGPDSGADGSGEMVWGPGAAPAGAGSAYFELGDAATGWIIGTQGHDVPGMRFDDISRLEYSTYRSAGGAAQAMALQFNVDYDLTDATASWQGRLVYEPYYTQTVDTGEWQTWNTLTTGANWWSTGNPMVGDGAATKHCVIADPCTWDEVLAFYPDAGIQEGILAGVILKAGSNWSGFEGNADQLKIATGATGTIFDFDPFDGERACIVDAGGGGDFLTVQAAIDTDACLAIEVLAGTYVESPAIDRAVHVFGEGDGLGGTIISGTVSITGNDVSLEDLRIQPPSSTSHGMVVSGTRTNLAMEGVTITGANAALRMGTADSLDGLTVSDSHFDGNDFGWAVFQSSTTPGLLDNVTVTDTTFSDNSLKGIYVEKLSNALFEDVTVANSGTDPAYGFNNGIDINLKYGDYSNIEIRNTTVTGSGLEGGGPFAPAGITIKARDDAPSYSAVPASVSNVTLDHVTVSGGVVGIRFGEEGKDNASPTDVVVTRSSIEGTSGVGLANTAVGAVDASCNWWGDASGPSGNGPGTGDSVSGDVDFGGWLETTDLDGTCSGGVLGPDPQFCNGLEATIVGTEGDDVIHGTDGDDVIVGLGGNDTINGHGGDDVICGGDGDDLLKGGAGDDILIGGSGNDVLRGGSGADLLRGGSGADELYGGNGHDRLKGGSGDDLLFGRRGDDRLNGGTGTDELRGGHGTDRGRNGETYFSVEVIL